MASSNSFFSTHLPTILTNASIRLATALTDFTHNTNHLLLGRSVPMQDKVVFSLLFSAISSLAPPLLWIFLQVTFLILRCCWSVASGSTMRAHSKYSVSMHSISRGSGASTPGKCYVKHTAMKLRVLLHGCVFWQLLNFTHISTKSDHSRLPVCCFTLGLLKFTRDY